MDSELMLVRNPGDYSLASEAMSRAGELRGEGLSPSEALSEAWAEIRGDEEDEDDGDNPIENPSSTQLTGIILVVALVGTLIHRIASGSWWWSKLGQPRGVAVQAIPLRPVQQTPNLKSYTQLVPENRTEAPIGMLLP